MAKSSSTNVSTRSVARGYKHYSSTPKKWDEISYQQWFNYIVFGEEIIRW
jgi:hypothetical protein